MLDSNPLNPNTCRLTGKGEWERGKKKPLTFTPSPFSQNPKSIGLHLPSPALVHPELLVPQLEELTDNNLSCAEIQARNYQSLFVNKMTSAIAQMWEIGNIAPILRGISRKSQVEVLFNLSSG
ncbi:hypothetical protein [Nostoc sp. C052]|uniref:hypothetical protein n=1 Tax=Nostoc sp. C052 TaxID=2576902 RepID=UPI003568E4D4